MFTIPNIFPFISTIGEEGDNGGGGEDQEPIDDELGVPMELPGEESQEPDDSEVAGINPAWNDVLNFIPEDKRGEVLPKLKSWDDNFAKVQSEFSPYKPLLENKVSMDEIQRAFAFANLVNTNPRGLYDQLAERFGFGQGQQQVNKDEEDDNDEDDNKPPVFDLTKSPEFQQMQQKLQQFEQAAQQQAEQERMAQEHKAIENEFTSIESEMKVKLTPKVREEILVRTVKIGDRTGNYDIREGYKDYASFVNQIRNSRASASAPRVFSGNGGLPANGKPMSELDDEQRAARIVAFLEAAGKEQ